MKNRDKILDYFDNVADGTVVSANDMYEHGFERMNQEAFFRAVERKQCVQKTGDQIGMFSEYLFKGQVGFGIEVAHDVKFDEVSHIAKIR